MYDCIHSCYLAFQKSSSAKAALLASGDSSSPVSSGRGDKDLRVLSRATKVSTPIPSSSSSALGRRGGVPIESPLSSSLSNIAPVRREAASAEVWIYVTDDCPCMTQLV